MNESAHSPRPAQTQPPVHPAGLAPCTRCAGRGVVRLYSEFGAARRTPYVNHPCPGCKGRGQALPPGIADQGVKSWLPYGVCVLLIVVAACLS